MDKLADLHAHTTASDGTFSPQQTVERAKEKGLAAIAITDHDTVSGWRDALLHAKKLGGIEVVPGIEISTVAANRDVHVLGYYVDGEQSRFLEQLEELRNTRNKRNHMMIDRLQQLGIEIRWEEVYSRKKDGENIGRPHIAEVLMEKGIVDSLQEAFDQYLGREGEAYVNPPRISPQEAIELIHHAGGVAVLAHPGLYDDVELIRQLIQGGLDGIEIYHPDHGEEEEKWFERMAKDYGLIMTAGSDFHGERNGQVFHGDLGSKTVPLDTVRLLKERAAYLKRKSLR